MKRNDDFDAILKHPVFLHVAWAILLPLMLFMAGAMAADAYRWPAFLSIGLTLVCWVGALLVIGVYLYFLRCRHRLAYGVVEVIAAIGIVTVTLVNTLTSFSRPIPNEALWWASSFGPWLQLAAAVYILVRGLDNVGQGLRGPGAERWKRVFEQ